jgi:creatinine amidohydrolase
MHLQEIEMELELFRDDGLVLANLTWPEVNEIRDEVELVLVPVGSNEQHGPNLAVQMDSRGAFEFARRASARMAPRLLVAPSVPIGVSHHHMNFPGTVTLTSETFIQVIVEIIESLLHHGFERFLIVNGHGGNIAAMETAALRAKSELEVPFVGACTYFSFFDPAVIARYETTAINGHACELETSVAMHMMPEIVRPDALAPAELTEFATSLRSDMRKYDVTVPFAFDEYTLNGALGDARLASAEFGRDLINSGLDNFCGFVERLLASSYLATASAAIPAGSRR